MKKIPHPTLWVIACLLAYCSIVYELLLAQSLAATLGRTFLRYNITIGFYLASLGLGSLLCGETRPRDLLHRLALVELGLAILGTLCPLLVFGVNVISCRAAASLDPSAHMWAYTTVAQAFNHGLIILVGVLSGFELPLLMGLGGDRKNEVLAFDYAGTVLGAALFPLVLLPFFGVIEAAAITGGLNALVGLYLLTRAEKRPGSLKTGAFVAVLALSGLILGTREELYRSCAAGFACAPSTPLRVSSSR